MTKYRKLRKGEILREGDEFMDIFGTWKTTGRAGNKVNNLNGLTYRRKIGGKRK